LERPGPCPIDDAYFSWAPLGDVSSTLVFYDQHTGTCQGIVFHYKNGAARAVGQCRPHVDPAESVVKPVRLCFRATSSTRRNQMIYKVQVKFKQDASTTCTEKTEKDIEGWESQPMQGLVKFWFTHESTVLVVEKGYWPQGSSWELFKGTQFPF
jgi:hypothetical protein